MNEDTRYCIYILYCADGTLYTGITCDLERRLAQHNAGKGARYTRDRLPVKLLYSWGEMNRSQATRVERRVKRLRRAQKEALIAGDQDILARISAGL